MRKVQFKNLKVQNFLSIGHDTVEVDFQNGLNLITGRNIDNPERVNGIGKSVIVEAYYYVLFGTTIRDIKKELVVNNVTKGGGRLELLFDIQTELGTISYRIVRTLKPSAVELWLLGDTEQNISKDSIANTNKYICDLIGSNAVISKSCDILSLTDNVAFMSKKPEEKRKFIEDVFTLEIFGRMMKELKELIKDNKSEMAVSKAKVEEINNSFKTLETQYATQKKRIDEREETLKKRREEIESNISKTKKEIKKLVIGNREHIVQQMNELRTTIYELKVNKQEILTVNLTNRGMLINLKDEFERCSNMEVGVKCSKCLQDIPHAQHEVYNQIKTNLLSEIEKVEAQIKDDNNKLIQLEINLVADEKLMKEFEECLRVHQDNSNKKTFLDANLVQYEDNLKHLDEELVGNDDILLQISADIGRASERYHAQLKVSNDLKQLADDYETCKFILGEEGVKSLIVKQLLAMLNTSIQYYISKLGMSMRCKFDEYFEEQMSNDKGVSISYWNMSGGERKTVDIACAWAFKDIKRKISGASSNVEFVDEVLDGALDEIGLDLLIDTLKERIVKNDMCCYAISHRKETAKHVDGEVVFLEKQGRITRRVLNN